MAHQPLKYKIVGIGGAGVSSLEQLLKDGAAAAEIIAVNTDVQSLSASGAGHKIQIGRRVTRGLGAGGDPELGAAAAEEAADDVRNALRGSGLVFISTGLGGGTGSGATPLITRLAREGGAYVVVFATIPFQFEGRRRMKQAEDALAILRREAHTVIVFENDRMGERSSPQAGINEVFANADVTLSHAITAIAGMTNREALIQLGLDELFSAINVPDSRCLFGYGRSNSEDRAIDALEDALQNPLMDRGLLLEHADNVVVQITGGRDLTLLEVQRLMDALGRLISDETHVLFGLGADEDSSEQVSVLILGCVAEAEFARRRAPNGSGAEERQVRSAPKRPALPGPAALGEYATTAAVRSGASYPSGRRHLRSFDEAAALDDRRNDEPSFSDEHPSAGSERDSGATPSQPPKLPASLRPPELQHPPLETPPPPSLDDDHIERGRSRPQPSPLVAAARAEDEQTLEKAPHQTSVGAGLSALVKKISQGVKKTGLVPNLSHADEEYSRREATRVVRPSSEVKTAPRDERTTPLKPKQEFFQFEQTTRGRFEKSQPTIVDGEDLDIPTFMRQKPK